MRHRKAVCSLRPARFRFISFNPGWPIKTISLHLNNVSFASPAGSSVKVSSIYCTTTSLANAKMPSTLVAMPSATNPTPTDYLQLFAIFILRLNVVSLHARQNACILIVCGLLGDVDDTHRAHCIASRDTRHRPPYLFTLHTG